MKEPSSFEQTLLHRAAQAPGLRAVEVLTGPAEHLPPRIGRLARRDWIVFLCRRGHRLRKFWFIDRTVEHWASDETEEGDHVVSPADRMITKTVGDAAHGFFDGLLPPVMTSRGKPASVVRR